ncbi:CIC11C00000002544 [Sungouiella intermedia]|uniref:CIC11C00000002544 n=1 Tax=Sungouiella intermedia TaxID=45354 RepID=A0A1L0BY80_9ASCO|nr:CIC11C00000002544 [[Candida] intermedia]
MIEATAVASNAGTSVVDLGIWKDSQAEKFRPIVQYAHANTAKIGIQLAHAGRKSMQSAMFEYLENWDPRGKKEELVAPSAITFRPGGRLPTPRDGSELHDSNPEAWTVEDSVKLAPIVVAKGVDFIDVSAGGNDSGADRPKKGFGMFVDFARRVKEAVGDTAVVSAVGRMHDPVKINELLEQGIIDFALVGSPFLVNQGLVIDWAKAMGVEIHNAAPFWPLRAKYGEMIKYINDSKIRAESSKF